LVGMGDDSGEFANAANRGNTSIDSTYLQVAARQGIIALIPLLFVLAMVIKTLIDVRGTWSAVIPAVTFVNMLGMFVVGLQTQHPIFIWLLIGATSGVGLAYYEHGRSGTA